MSGEQLMCCLVGVGGVAGQQADADGWGVSAEGDAGVGAEFAGGGRGPAQVALHKGVDKLHG